MPNPIKYSTSAQTLALKKGNFWIGTGDVSKGTSVNTDYWNGITPPSGGYTIYLNKASQGPSIFVASNDTDLITITNKIAGSAYATAADCLSYFTTQSDKIVFNRDYEAIVTNGLVLNLDAGFVSSYPKTGTTLYDLSTSVNNGTLTNGPTYNSADGGSITFDGVDDYIDCGSFSVGNPATITVACWIKPNINTGRNDFVTKWDTGTNTPNTRTFNLLHGVVNGKFGFYISTDGTNTPTSGTSTTTIVVGTWYYVVGTYNGATIGLYVNGVLENSNTQTGNLYWTSTRTLNIGANPGDVPGRYTNGNIAQVSIYNRSLSAAEVLQNYNAQKSRFGL